MAILSLEVYIASEYFYYMYIVAWNPLRMRMRIVIDWQHNTFFVYLADADRV